MAFKTNNPDEMMSRLKITINGPDRKSVMNKVRIAQDTVLEDMVNWTRDNHDKVGGEFETTEEGLFDEIEGGWINVTDNLQNSIDYKPSEIEGNRITGYLKAGMEYAPDVEKTEGHWVLSGAINNFRNTLLSTIAKRVAEQ